MRKSNIKSFSIKNLFKDRNVNIKFSDDIKILIGENGLGKTTVLNILYYTLDCKFYKLKEYDFDSIEITFLDRNKITISKEMLEFIDYSIEGHYDTALLDHLSIFIESLSNSKIKELNELLDRGYPNRTLFNFLGFDEYAENYTRRYPPSIIRNTIKQVLGFRYGSDSKIGYAKEILEKELLNTEILYFPTFRRIEEDLINLGLDSENNRKVNTKDSRLIQFGMTDVKDKFKELQLEINSLSSQGLSQISSEILSQLVKGVPEIDNEALKNINKKDIDIILARVGEAISKEDKNKITTIFASKKIKEVDDKYLVYFLQKLIAIYEKQREIDNNIERFVFACNNYLPLSGKRIEYEASTVEFFLIFNHSNQKVLLTDLLSKLSSGEKQIISLFSKIYLSSEKEFVVLFDEPELSLSLFWQKRLLPDIVASDRCKLLLSVTHSPFIFENELEKYAIGLNQYIKFL